MSLKFFQSHTQLKLPFKKTPSYLTSSRNLSSSNAGDCEKLRGGEKSTEVRSHLTEPSTQVSSDAISNPHVLDYGCVSGQDRDRQPKARQTPVFLYRKQLFKEAKDEATF